ncbi:MAG: 50S ribosomal protein L10 [Verrucomicrobia bacterium]|nr:50S ribosomal protein L10 [Verrucomicrobiota bacterium]MCG2679023.1 50S ribosomal protein L10 [Kiritimatiellia bacterium]MBU4248375.1 50S ribosomal protein L10 [Verrucomicrobiota bacterium]MBU4289760.1 50S ribosomal protein L10 [Verrucomicrobiota bacterium]MBU4428526.1 50S ribosomal protein L10 [Verrucomicrobiota bacterium]
MRLEKKSINDDLRAWLVNAGYVILTDYRGMKVRQSDALRHRLAKLHAQIHVVPNRLCKRVVAELNWGPADQAFLGPTALVTGSGDVIEAAKLLKEFNDENRLPTIKLGRFDGRYFSPADIEILVNLPAKPVLYSMLVGTIAAPMSQLVGVLKQKVSSLVYVLKAVQDKKSQAK